jgi:hypothetical protein
MRFHAFTYLGILGGQDGPTVSPVLNPIMNEEVEDDADTEKLPIPRAMPNAFSRGEERSVGRRGVASADPLGGCGPVGPGVFSQA